MKDIEAAAERLTLAQRMRTIQLLRQLSGDGCAFAQSRRWESKDCGKDSGFGYDCTSCAACKLLKELGLKTPDEEAREREEERRRHAPKIKKNPRRK